MALTNGSNASGGELIILKPVSKNDKGESVKPFFSVTRKINGKWEKTTDEFDSVSGNLVDLDIKEQEYNKAKYKVISLFVQDGNEKYLLDLRFSITSRTLFNMMASLQTGENIKISYYLAKNGYERYSLRQNDQLVEWKYGLDQLPKPIEIVFKGQTQRDYTPVDELMENELIALKGRITGKKTATVAKPTKTANQSAQQEGDEPPPF